MDQRNCRYKCAQQFSLAHSAYSADLLGRRSFERRAGPRKDTMCTLGHLFTLAHLGVAHWCFALAHDKTRQNGERQDLAQSFGHQHKRFGSSGLAAGRRAKATKATAGPSEHTNSLWLSWASLIGVSYRPSTRPDNAYNGST